MQKVVDRCNLIVLVIIQAVFSIVLFESELFKHREDGAFNWYHILSNDQALILADRLILLEPLVFSYPSSGVS